MTRNEGSLNVVQSMFVSPDGRSVPPKSLQLAGWSEISGLAFALQGVGSQHPVALRVLGVVVCLVVVCSLSLHFLLDQVVVDCVGERRSAEHRRGKQRNGGDSDTCCELKRSDSHCNCVCV